MIACIPTKNRVNTKTYKLFQEAGIDVYHFIEPDEIEKYKVPNKINIQKNNMGISYVRNFILDWSKQNNQEWIIVCDDDVDHFGEYNNGNIKRTATIWKEILNKVKFLPFEIVGINYRQLAWTAKEKYSINSKFVEVCILINIQKINWSYRGSFNLKEDRDFLLQCIKFGNGVLRFNKYFYNSPNIGSNKGGLYDLYQEKKDQESAIKMCKEWSPFVTLIKKSGRVDIKTDIKSLALHYKKNVK